MSPWTLSVSARVRLIHYPRGQKTVLTALPAPRLALIPVLTVNPRFRKSQTSTLCWNTPIMQLPTSSRSRRMELSKEVMPLSIHGDLFPELARLTRLDRLIPGYLMEVIATQQDPAQCRKSISLFVKTLTVRFATHLAKTIASLFRPVLYHPHMIQFVDNTEPLLTSKFWVRPVYEELLHAASRFNMSNAAERKRPTSNLVKVSSHTREPKHNKLLTVRLPTHLLRNGLELNARWIPSMSGIPLIGHHL